MTAPVQIGDALLYQGDAAELIARLPAADLVVTDPPYLLTAGGQGRGHMAGKFNGQYDNSGRIVACEIGWPEIMRVVAVALRDGGDAYVMADDKNITRAANAAEAARLKHHRHLVWHKTSGTPNRWYMKSAEFALYLYAGSPRTVNDCGMGQVFVCPPGTDTGHPTEKPIRLMQAWIEQSSNPGDLIIDPFMGSGTTGIAALRAGRRFIGIEIDPKWHDVARKRISAFVTGADLAGVPNLFTTLGKG
ncbi:DNA-methyltransferase [Sneathiella sp.]|uniref:DNA-methyltransferase n=1 Tax=Sneathiella sp. TaxID=1964365 RepID=UPI002FE2BD93